MTRSFGVASTVAEKCETFALGTQRLAYKFCQKRFTTHPVKRTLSEEKQELTENFLAQRISLNFYLEKYQAILPEPSRSAHSRERERGCHLRLAKKSVVVVEEGLPYAEEPLAEESVEMIRVTSGLNSHCSVTAVDHRLASTYGQGLRDKIGIPLALVMRFRKRA